MDFEKVISRACSAVALAGSSKKRVLENAALRMAAGHAEVDADSLFDALMARERLGSTAVGDGVAIPHCRMAACQRPFGALFRLEEAVDFDAPDKQPVDLLFLLVVPEEAHETHLQILASAASAFNEPSFRARLRHATCSLDLCEAAHYSRDSQANSPAGRHASGP